MKKEIDWLAVVVLTGLWGGLVGFDCWCVTHGGRPLTWVLLAAWHGYSLGDDLRKVRDR